MPNWLPGADYLTNFHVGDPYTKVDEGYARLPGAGYEALHPELKGIDPRDYPDINKLAILADVAPYSREYNIFRSKVGADSANNTELRIEYEKILDRVRQTRESVIRMDNRRFTEPVDEIEGTIETATPGGVTLKEHQVSPSSQPKNVSRGRGRSRTHSPPAPPEDPEPSVASPFIHPLSGPRFNSHGLLLRPCIAPGLAGALRPLLWLRLSLRAACRIYSFVNPEIATE